MTQTIEQLTARVRELEEENARLVKLDAKRKKQLSDFDDVIDGLNVVVSCINPVEDLKRAIAALKEQAAASQAYAEQLRVALVEAKPLVQDWCNENGGAGLAVFVRLRETLTLPRDTSALDAYVAKRLHDMACDKGLLRIQVEELTRQRDLAVDALENCRLLAARHRKEEWAGHIMRFCKDAGLSGSPIRNDSIKESKNNKAS